jgi:hypothetical protein
MYLFLWGAEIELVSNAGALAGIIKLDIRVFFSSRF